MTYGKNLTLNDGRRCILRNAEGNDGQAVIDCFIKTHSETDFLLSYPDETTMTTESEGRFLSAKEVSPNEVQILAIVDGVVVGCAGVDAIGSKYKVSHRAEFGVSVLEGFWGLGIGRALMEACIECAKDAGYGQLELDVVADNARAVSLYSKAGFVECGRNPKGFRSRTSGFQELVRMRKEL